MVMTYASPIVHETMSTDSVKETGASGDLHLINDHQDEGLDRTPREGWLDIFCCQAGSSCCKRG